MYKQITYSSHINVSGKSRKVIYPVYPNTDHTFQKCAEVADLHPEIRDFVSRIKPDPEYIYVVVVALGAGESWSSNVNGDWFGRDDLQKKHNTFIRNGKVFHLHDNKPDSPSYGAVMFSRFNPSMDRVELVISVSRTGLPEVVETLERGEMVDVSMGTKVDHDVCSICGKKSKRFTEYCSHLKYEMNRVYPDGRKVYALNPDPEFFDISFVDSGADRTAKALAKVAAISGVRDVVHSVLLGEKLSKEKGAEMDKGLSMVEKALPAKLKQYWLALGHNLESCDKVDLRQLNSDIPVSDALNLATDNDVILNPSEFFSFIIDRMFGDQSNFRDLSDQIFNNNLSIWDDSDSMSDLDTDLDFTGSLPLQMPNLFSLKRKLSPGALTMRMRLVAGDTQKLAAVSGFSKLSINKQIDKTLCSFYRKYVKTATKRIIKKADISGINLATGLLATLILGHALLEQPTTLGHPISLGSSDVLGIPLPAAMKASDITESELQAEVDKQLQQLERIRRGAVDGSQSMLNKTAVIAKIPSQVLATAAHYLESCGTKTAQIGRDLTQSSPVAAAIFLKLGKILSV